MDIVTHGNVRLYGCFAGERLLAGLPIWPCTTLGVRRLRQPPLTPYWGPILHPLCGSYRTRMAGEEAILTALAEALKPWQDIALTFHPTLTNWLGFYWQRFTQTTRYTYRIENWHETSLVEVTSHESIRSGLRRALKFGLTIHDMIDPSIVTRLAALAMERQGLQSSQVLQQFWPALTKAALERNCMFTTSVVNEEGKTLCAVATVWDERCAYGIFGGCDPQYLHTGAWPLCMARELELARSVAPSYDFEGSMLESVEPFFRRFGGTLTPYFLITRASAWQLNAARYLADRYLQVKWRHQQWRAQRKLHPEGLPVEIPSVTG